MTGSAIVAMISSLSLAWAGTSSLLSIFIGAIGFGAASFPIYTIALAHANDLVPTKRAIAVSSGMLFIFSTGAAIGPLVASVIVEYAGFSALFSTIGIACGFIGLVTVVRIQIRPRLSRRHREDYVNVPRTTPAIFDLDPRTDDAPAIAIEPLSLTEPHQHAVPEVIAPDGILPPTTHRQTEPA